MPEENFLLQALSSSPIDEERRRSKRMDLQVPLFVRGRNASDDQFMELAKTLDISAVGAFIVCPLSVTVAGTVTLTIPAPSITSNALVPTGMPPIQAKVTRRQELGDVQLIGVEFLTPLG